MLLFYYRTKIWRKNYSRQTIKSRISRKKGIANTDKKEFVWTIMLFRQFFCPVIFFVHTVFCLENFFVRTKGNLPPRRILPVLFLANVERVSFIRMQDCQKLPCMVTVVGQPLWGLQRFPRCH